MSQLWRSRSLRHATTAIALLFAIGGAIAIGVAVRAQRSAPQPSASAAGTVSGPPAMTAPLTPSTTVHRPPPTAPAVRVLPRSVPTEITIPSIGLHSALIQLGQNSDGSVEVPTSFHVAGWYQRSVAPGQLGPSIILGHVDSKAGPGIFFRLGSLRPGDHVMVTRADGSTATFRITGVREYLKTQFPTLAVYGNTSVPAIRLVTCGGLFDRATGHYLSNIVAFGQLI